MGTGPYVLADWKKGSSITLTARPERAARPAIKRVTFRFINDPAAQVAALLAGDVDGMPRLGALQSLKQFQADKRFTVQIGSTAGKGQLTINNKKKPFDDVRVRRAIMHAIDRDAFIDGVLEGLGQPIGSHFAPTDAGYMDLTGVYPYDPEKAKALLKEAGVATPLNVTLTLPPPQYARKGGEVVAAMLAKVGINAKIENVEWAQWLSGPFKGNFDLTIINHVEPLDYAQYTNKDYYWGYDSKVFDGLFADYAGTTNAAEAPAPVAADAAPAGHRRRQRLDLQPGAGDGGEEGPAGPVDEARRSSPTTSPPCAGGRDLARAVGGRAAGRLPAARVLAGRGGAGGARPHRALGAAHPRAVRPRARAACWRRRGPREARWQRGAPLALDGVPLTLKENIATAGTPMPLGTRGHRSWCRPAADAPPAARLREAGAVLLAKTTMPDWGMLSVGPVELPPADAQPLGPAPATRAAAAPAPAPRPRPATGRCTWAPTSAARSGCRRPGAACSALKPSVGRIPIHPPLRRPRRRADDAHACDDAALMMAVLSLPDVRDTTSLPPQAIDWAAPAHRRCAACGWACGWTPAGAWRSSPRRAARGGGRGARASRPPAPSSSRWRRS